MAAAYATAEQYETWSGEAAPANIAWLLARATELIDAIVVAGFDLDEETELPTDADMAAALRDAVCAQVRFWGEVGYYNDIDGLAGSKYMLTGSSGYQGQRAPEKAPQALRILRNASLL